MITSIKFVSIPVSDQDRALAFYTEKLGFKVVTDQQFGLGQRWIELQVGGSPTRLVLFTPEGHEDRVGGVFNGALACDNVDKTYEELTRRGVEFAAPPKHEPWGSVAILKDPDGNQIALSSR
ncbi:MAG TPA: VOC family protein [Pyrinomonadaceae bacterium]|nr:VOC family protein [Pyrinomonadaceae bacterium]